MKISVQKFYSSAFPLIFFVALLCLLPPSLAHAQEMARPQQEHAPVEKHAPFRLLNLTQDQISQIRDIRTQSETEGRALLRRMNMARRALDAALYADNSDEALIQQRANELADAQASVTRMRAQVEWKIRRVLSPTQLSMLREIRLRAQQERRQERRNRALQPNNAFGPRPLRTPNAENNKPDRQRLPFPRMRRRGLLHRQP